MQRRAFVSYAREDAAAVERLAVALRTLRCDVWFDEALAGGQAWWDVILDRVRSCDVFVCAVSRAMLESVACMAELDYAARVRRPLLPVLIEPMPAELLPSALAVIQTVDFTAGAQDPGLHLAGAILGLPPALHLPQPLPPSPPAPISYLSSLAERARVRTLTDDEQLAMMVRLEEAWTRPAERLVAQQIVQLMLRRDDLLHRVAVRLHALNAVDATREEEPAPTDLTRDWSARLVHTQRKERTFEVGNGSRTWIVVYRFGFSPKSDKVFVDGRAVYPKIGKLPHDLDVGITNPAVVQFVVGSSEQGEAAAQAMIASRGYVGLQPQELALIVDGQVLYREAKAEKA